MAGSKSFYITTTLPYVNAEPHIGFAYELVQADVIARWKKEQGFEVFFNTGTDEHGQKIYSNALVEGKEPQKYTDELAQKFKGLQKLLDLSGDLHFIRTTEERHKIATQEFWKLCDKSGDIYKKNYKMKYCVGCELEKTDSELVDSKCPVHPSQKLEIREEENYFFKFSKYGDKLLKLYDKDINFVMPDSRLNEIRVLIEQGLEDFSISRLKEKMPWGIEVPGDSEHVMYVWFDALVDYISTLGWPEDKENFEKFWKKGTPTQLAGKDQVRQQAAMWQAMLMSAGLPNSHQIIIHGFINSGGQKMSKSLGNVISPDELAEKYGTDAVRYLLLRHVHPTEDTDVTWKKLDEWYNAGLADGLGNTVSRIMKLSEDNLDTSAISDKKLVAEVLNEYKFDSVMNNIWGRISELDKEIQEEKPWESKDKEIIRNLVFKLYQIGRLLEPFMPKTSEIIVDATKTNKKPENLFPKINA